MAELLSEAGRAEIEENITKRKVALDSLTSTPFDINNKSHMDTLTKYINEFEYTVNQLYLYTAMAKGLQVYGGAWVLGYLLPIPEFAKSALTYAFYAGIAGYVLKGLNITDYRNQLNEMRTLYNWCLKGGKDLYSSSINNADTLSCPDIQRMINVMTPLCSPQFLVAWPREAKPEQNNGGIIYNVFASGYDALNSAYSIFSRSNKPAPDQILRIRELKNNVENNGGTALSAYLGLEQAIKYFISNPAVMAAKLAQPINSLKQMIPDTIQLLRPKIS